jgi:hypothetical protein
MLNGLQMAEELEAYDWVVIVSGQDFPVVPLVEWEGRVASSGANALVRRHFEVGTRLHWGRRRSGVRIDLVRYTHKYWRLGARKARRHDGLRHAVRWRLERFALNLAPLLAFHEHPASGSVIGIRRLTVPPPAAWPPVKASQWIALDRKAVRHVLDAAGQPEISRPWSRTYIPEEGYIQTILYRAPDLNVVDQSVSIDLFDPPGVKHPAIVTTANLPSLLDRARQQDAAFLRKFDESEPDAIDAAERAGTV